MIWDFKSNNFTIDVPSNLSCELFTKIVNNCLVRDDIGVGVFLALANLDTICKSFKICEAYPLGTKSLFIIQ